MVKDKFLELALAQVVTTSAPTTNVIDQGAAGNAIGTELFLVAQVKAAVTAAGAATLEFKIETSVDEAFTAPIQLFSSGAIPKADLVIGKEIAKVKMPLGAKRYIRGYFTIGTGPLLTGKFDVFFAETVDAK